MKNLLIDVNYSFHYDLLTESIKEVNKIKELQKVVSSSELDNKLTNHHRIINVCKQELKNYTNSY